MFVLRSRPDGVTTPPDGAAIDAGDVVGVSTASVTRTEKPRPRLCFVGPMVGRYPGHVTTQGEILAGRFQAAGYEVVSVSSAANRYARLVDIAGTLVRQRRHVDIVLIQV